MATLGDALRAKIDSSTVVTTEGLEVYRPNKRSPFGLIVDPETGRAKAWDADGEAVEICRADHALAALRALRRVQARDYTPA